MRADRWLATLVSLGVVAAAACDSDAPGGRASGGDGAALGPVDGRDLPPVDTGRVAVGDLAPDFSLASWAGDMVTLSDHRGNQNVVLVFYRGHW